MAFLCPSRLGRNKHKRGYQSMMRKLANEDRLDKITLEDLVKLSWTTPESRRIIMQNFTSCEPQEVNVKQGQKVNYIYREGDWAYIVTDDRKEGFVPFIFLAKIGVPSKPGNKVIDSGTYTKRCSDLNPRNFSVESEETDHSESDPADDSFISPGWSTDSGSVTTVKEHQSLNYLDTEPFKKLPMFYEVFLDERTNILHKNPLPSPGRSDDNEIPDNNNNQHPVQFKVMFNFSGLDLYDVSVKVGDIVDLLDDSDPGWFLVRRSDGFEGYVPSNYITQLPRQSVSDIESSDNDTLESKAFNEHVKNVVKNKNSIKTDKTNEIPTNWKITNDLKGKSPNTIAQGMTEETSKPKKQRPKKPPRKKKANLDNLSPRLDESIDSIDTFVTESSAEYLENSVKSPLDGLSPRSDDSSVFESSFNGVYGNRQCASALSDMEPSSTSLNVQSCDDITSENTSVNDSVIDKISVSTRDDNTTRSTNRGQKHEPNRYKRIISCETIDSFESRSSHGQKQKRPVSLPAFRTYQEYKKDYFDEYFYDDDDTKFSYKSKHDVVNVAEILKKRDQNENNAHVKHKVHSERRSEEYHRVKKASSTVESKFYDQWKNGPKEVQNQTPKLKQILLELPSTKIEKQMVSMNRSSSINNYDDDANANIIDKALENKNSSEKVQKCSKAKVENEYNEKDVNSPEMFGYSIAYDLQKLRDNRARQYNSSTDLRKTYAKHSKDSEKYALSNHLLGKSDKKNENKQKKTHIRPYNSSTDLRDFGVKPDWSFGYPRRTRQSIGRQENGNQCIEVTNSSKGHKKGSERKNNGNNQKKVHKTKQCDSFQNYNDSHASTKQTSDVKITDKSRNAERENCTNVLKKDKTEKTNFDDEAMMALLQQTDNLLNKTDVLIHRDKTGRGHKQEVNNLHTNNKKVLRKRNKHNVTLGSDNNENKYTDSLTSHSKVADATDKCNLFLNNSTIGIHGMTYLVTTDNENTNEQLSIDTSSENLESKITCYSIESNQSLNSDSRKEKSSVMKDNSSEVVSEEIKSMDLQDIRGITEFVCQCDNDNDIDDMLPIKYGEIVHIGLDGQDNGEKYWAFSPRLKKYGFVFKQNVKIPMVTII